MNPKILVCFAIISSGALLGCSNVARGDEVSGPKPAQLSPALEFDSLQMIDRDNGWAQNVRMVFRTNDWVPNAMATFRTRNGGESWENVSPAGLGDSVASFFRDSETAWIATFLMRLLMLLFFGPGTAGAPGSARNCASLNRFYIRSWRFPMPTPDG